MNGRIGNYYGVIYIIVNKINGHFYIGKTIRKGKEFDNYWGSGLIIKRAIKKHIINGHNIKDVFCKNIIRCCDTLKELNHWERKYIKKWNATNRVDCYNISDGGEGDWSNVNNHPHKKEIYKKAVATRKRNDPNGNAPKKIWKSRRKNDPNNIANKRGAKTRVKNGTNIGWGFVNSKENIEKFHIKLSNTLRGLYSSGKIISPQKNKTKQEFYGEKRAKQIKNKQVKTLKKKYKSGEIILPLKGKTLLQLHGRTKKEKILRKQEITSSKKMLKKLLNEAQQENVVLKNIKKTDTRDIKHIVSLFIKHHYSMLHIASVFKMNYKRVRNILLNEFIKKTKHDK